MKSANKSIDRIANKTGFCFMERVRWSVRGTGRGREGEIK